MTAKSEALEALLRENAVSYGEIERLNLRLGAQDRTRSRGGESEWRIRLREVTSKEIEQEREENVRGRSRRESSSNTPAIEVCSGQSGLA